MNTNENKNGGIRKESPDQLPFNKKNYIMMGICIFLIILGFCLMAGKPSTPEAFNPDIFSTRRIVVGPTIAFAGFLLMAFAIIWRPGCKKEKN